MVYLGSTVLHLKPFTPPFLRAELVERALKSKSRPNGGVERARGGYYQDYSLLYYLLLRLADYPDLVATIEAVEDATVRYDVGTPTTASSPGAPTRITEFIQCKKREQPTGSAQAGLNDGDPWIEGRYTRSDLDGWVCQDRGGTPLIARLDSDEGLFYTALVFGTFDNTLFAFAPEPIRDYLPINYPFPDRRAAFPAQFCHLHDPLPSAGDRFGTATARRRVRLIRTASPEAMRANCLLLLEQDAAFKVVASRALDVLKELFRLVSTAATTQGTLTGGELQAVIAQGRAGQGRWENGAKILEHGRDAAADLERGEALGWADFAKGRFAERSEFDAAWVAASLPGALMVVSGAVGTGKTTLCRRLLYEFQRQAPTHSTFYLAVQPEWILAEETEFLKANLHLDALFIVDDEHLAVEELEELIQTFLDAQAITRARLVISTKINYGRAGGLAQGRTSGLLREAALISLPNQDLENLRGLLAQARARGCFSSSLSDRDLAVASKGVFGIAMLIASVGQRGYDHRRLETLLASQEFRTRLRTWILDRLRPGVASLEDFETRVLPVFLLGAFSLPIPEYYTGALPAMINAGFVEEIYPEKGGAAGYTVENSNLAFLLQMQHVDLLQTTLQSYIDRFPEWLPRVLTRTAEWPQSRDRFLPALIDANLDQIRSAVRRGYHSLSESASLLELLHRINPRGATEIFEEWIKPRGGPNRAFTRSLVERATSAAELRYALEVCRRLDRQIHELANVIDIDESHIELIRLLITSASCQVDQAGACLAQLWHVDADAAEELNDDLVESDHFRERLVAAAQDGSTLSELLRYCQFTKRFDRLRVYDLIEYRLRCEEKAGRLLVSSETAHPLARFLTGLRAVHPLEAARVLQSVWETQPARLLQAASRETDLDALIQALYSFSLNHRGVAIQVTSALVSRLPDLVNREPKYAVIGASLNWIRRHISRKLAASVAAQVEIGRIRDLLSGETRYADTVGRFLHQFAEILPEAATSLVEGLDYQELLRRCRLPRLRDVTIVVAGFLRAAGPERRTALLDQMHGDHQLVELFSDRWHQAGTASECAFCILQLQQASLTNTEIRRLLGEAGVDDIIERLRSLIGARTPLTHTANGLLGLARLELGAAKEVLGKYLGNVSASDPSARRGSRDRFGARRGSSAGFAGSRDLVEIGCLLHVASSIDEELGRQLAAGLDVHWVVHAAESERNLGRLTVFLGGLAHASRSLARHVVEGLSSEELWRDQYEHNESAENLGNYSRVLRTISKRRAREFGAYMFSEFGEELLGHLRTEVNLSVIANWVRILRRSTGGQNEQCLAQLALIANESAEYDGSLWRLLDVAEAFIEANDLATARSLCQQIMASRSQINALDRPHDWIAAVCRCLHMERVLKDDGLVATLLTPLRPEVLSKMILNTGDLLVAAWMCFMIGADDRLQGSVPEGRLAELQQELQQRAAQQRPSLKRLLTLCFAQAPDAVLDEAVDGVDWSAHDSWEAGLALLALQVTGKWAGGQHLLARVSHTDLLRPVLERAGAAEQSNLSFALTVYLHHAAGRLLVNAALRRELAERREEESSAAVNWLISNYASASDVARLPYYVWSYLRDTVLRATYLPWEKEVEEVVDSLAFGHRHRSDLASLATT